MRILLAAKHPPGGKLPIGGVQSWMTTAGAEMERLGHEVAFWGPEWPLPAGRFDAGVVANATHTRAALARCGRVLVVSHGIVPDEAPAGERVAYTSEGVRDHWKGDGPILRQPLDLAFWTPADAPRRFLTRFSYRRGLDFLPALAKRMGLQFRHVADLSPADARAVLRESAVVLATGRAALEAMACGAPVVICDDRRYQGPLLDPDTTGAMARNYSGRGGVVPTPENVAEAVQHATGVGSLRRHVEAHHDARAVTQQILELLTC